MSSDTKVATKDLGEIYLTLEDVMLKTGYKRQTLYNKISSGELVGEKWNGQHRFTMEEVDRFIEAQRDKPKLDPAAA